MLTLRNLIASAVLAASLLGAGGSTAAACDPPCRYVKVVAYRYQRQPVVTYVTVVDKYGCAHRVPKVCYQVVAVPYVDYIKVCR